jgi:oligopeptide transport system substrate-binding protein
MKWSDGEPLKAEHFIASWKRLLSSNSPWAGDFYVVRGARAFHEGKDKNFNNVGVKALNDKSIQINLNAPVEYFLALMAHHSTYPIRADLLAKNGNKWPDVSKLVTLGPFTIEKTKSDYLALKRNENYVLKKPKLKSVFCYFGLNPEDAVERFKSGEVQAFVDAPAETAQAYGKRDEVFLTPLLDVTYLTFNVRQKPMSNPIFRRVVGMSIDREDLTHSLHTSVRAIGGMVPPGLIGYESNRGVRFDPDAAKTLRQHSGYSDLKNYDPFYLRVSLGSEEKAAALNIQTQLKNSLGVEVKLALSDKELPSQARVIYLSHWSASIPDPDNFLDIFTGQSLNNPTGWKNKNYDEFVKQAAVSSSIDQREKLYAKAQHILTETEMPVIPLFLNTQYSLVNRRVHNFPLNAMGLMPFRSVVIE